ncbi:MAG: hypothetical protein J0M12_07180, partial [Deltaproteobacteria bacterium]|nr:hypothetical protein [Deltaproteobacteria bacterium]
MIPGRAASIRFAMVVCACLSLSACSRKVTAPAATDLNAGVKAENSSQPASPFTLEIVEDLNDGSNLHIHGRVQTAAEWPAEDVVVRLSGMKAGESHQVSFFPLNKLQQRQADAKTTNRLVPGTPFDFYLSAPSSELTDYQVELLWGKEAKGVSATEPPVDPTQAQGLLLQALSIQRVIPHCAVEPCPSTYRLSGSFLNNSATTVQDAQLGVGFVWV